jgi:putative two-component system response regulator
VGKIGVPDDILRKPGSLTVEEMATMRRHVAEGSLLLEGSPSPVLQVAEIIVDTHHERWDGTGYPNGLKGEDIPLEGRIAAVCDVFDALTHERPYKRAWTVRDACQEIERLRGSHFDPAVADALLAVVGRGLKPGPSAEATLSP